MPATLGEAYISPFHQNINYYNTVTRPLPDQQSDSLSSLKNPNYYDFQQNYRVKKLDDIVSEADEIKSVYHKPTSLKQTENDTDSAHNCNILIAKMLSCPKCRNKLREILLDDDTRTVADQKGGGSGSGSNLLDSSVKNLLINVLYGLILLLLMDMLLRFGKT